MDIEKKYNKLRGQFIGQLLEMLNKEEIYDLSEDSLQQVAINLKLDPNYYLILFPGGLADCLACLSARLDEQSVQLAKKELENIKSVRGRIALMLENRIIDVVQKPVQQKIHNQLKQLAHLEYKCKSVFNSCDAMWQAIGDQSTDFNFYTKRGLLALVYHRVMSVYLSDHSQNFQQTRDYIKSSLNKIIKIASIKNKIKLPNKEDIPIIRLFS